jgi:hypothetical protein
VEHERQGLTLRFEARDNFARIHADRDDYAAHAAKNGKSRFISSLSGLRPYSQISNASANLIFSARSFP